MPRKLAFLLVGAASLPLLLVGVVGFHLTRGAWFESRYRERLEALEREGLLPSDEDLAPQGGPAPEATRDGLREVRELLVDRLPAELAGPGGTARLDLSDRDWTPTRRREVARLLAPLDEVFELAHAVTSDRPALLTLEEDRPIFAGEARLQEMRRWADLLAARLRLDALAGDSYGAAGRLRTGFRLGRLVDEGLLIGSLLRAGSDGILMDEVQARLARGELRGSVVFEVVGRELDVFLDADHARTVLAREMAGLSELEPVQPCPAEGVSSYLDYPSECASLLAGLEAWERGLALVEEDPDDWEEAHRGFLAELPGDDRLGAGTALSGVHALRRHRSRVVLFHVALAVHAFRETNGVWPRSLDELEPLFRDGVPVDPWTGRPFPYGTGPDGALRLGPHGAASEADPATLERTGALWVLR